MHSFISVVTMGFLYARHLKSKDEEDKIFACKNLQCRRMWEGVRQYRKLCKHPKRRNRPCVERI